jgi:hypothetical protein
MERSVPVTWAAIASLMAAAGVAVPGVIQAGRVTERVSQAEARLSQVENSGSRSLLEFRGEMRERLARIEAAQALILERLESPGEYVHLSSGGRARK